MAKPLRTLALLSLCAACGDDPVSVQPSIAVEEEEPTELCPDGGFWVSFRGITVDSTMFSNESMVCLGPRTTPLYQFDCTWRLDVVDGDGRAEPDGRVETHLQWQAVTFSDGHVYTACAGYDTHELNRTSRNSFAGLDVGTPTCLFEIEYAPKAESGLVGEWQFAIHAAQAWAQFVETQSSGSGTARNTSDHCEVKRWDGSEWVPAELP